MSPILKGSGEIFGFFCHYWMSIKERFPFFLFRELEQLDKHFGDDFLSFFIHTCYRVSLARACDFTFRKFAISSEEDII
ncbi:MAG: hypothetical protein ACH349_02675 [Candidatus Rhabdochlamydia sp.]|jgi:hypothetical protein